MSDHDAIATEFFAYFAGNLGPEPGDVRPGDFAICRASSSGWPRAFRCPTTDDLRAALTTGPGMSFFFVAGDDHGHVAAFDCDGDAGEANARRLAARALDVDLPCLLDISPSGGHVWFSLDRRLPRIALRRGLLAIAQAVGLDRDPKVELRPVDGTTYGGGALRAPGTVSPKSGRRSVLVDPATGKDLPLRLSELLPLVKQASAKLWIEVGEAYRPPEPPAERRRRADRDAATFDERVGVSVVLARSWGLAGAIPGRNIRCPAHDDRRPSMSITRDDRRATCHVPTCRLYRDGRGVDAWELAQLAEAAR